jgi:hypothetical protein
MKAGLSSLLSHARREGLITRNVAQSIAARAENNCIVRWLSDKELGKIWSEETKHDQATRRCWKLREGLKDSGSLFESIPMWTKPKGMHWRAFWRLVEKDELRRQDLMERIIRLCDWVCEKGYHSWIRVSPILWQEKHGKPD